jgi:hypothetical protein
MPATAAGDAAFATAAAITLFGAAANEGSPIAILGYMTNAGIADCRLGMLSLASQAHDSWT